MQFKMNSKLIEIEHTGKGKQDLRTELLAQSEIEIIKKDKTDVERESISIIKSNNNLWLPDYKI